MFGELMMVIFSSLFFSHEFGQRQRSAKVQHYIMLCVTGQGYLSADERKSRVAPEGSNSRGAVCGHGTGSLIQPV